MKYVKEQLSQLTAKMEIYSTDLTKENIFCISNKYINEKIHPALYSKTIISLLELLERYHKIEIIHVNTASNIHNTSHLDFKYLLVGDFKKYIFPIDLDENLKFVGGNIRSKSYRHFISELIFVLINIDNGEPQLILIEMEKDGPLVMGGGEWLDYAIVYGTGSQKDIDSYKLLGQKLARRYTKEIERVLSNSAFKKWICDSLRTVEDTIDYVLNVRKRIISKYAQESKKLFIKKDDAKYDNLIGTKPTIHKFKTIDNKTKYWNIMEIQFNILERNRDRSTLFNLIKKNLNDIINNEVWPLVKEKIGEQYLSFLKIGNIVFTQTGLLVITIQYKGDKYIF